MTSKSALSSGPPLLPGNMRASFSMIVTSRSGFSKNGTSVFAPSLTTVRWLMIRVIAPARNAKLVVARIAASINHFADVERHVRRESQRLDFVAELSVLGLEDRQILRFERPMRDHFVARKLLPVERLDLARRPVVDHVKIRHDPIIHLSGVRFGFVFFAQVRRDRNDKTGPRARFLSVPLVDDLDDRRNDVVDQRFFAKLFRRPFLKRD